MFINIHIDTISISSIQGKYFYSQRLRLANDISFHNEVIKQNIAELPQRKTTLIQNHKETNLDTILVNAI